MGEGVERERRRCNPASFGVKGQRLGLGDTGFEVELAVAQLARPILDGLHELVRNTTTAKVGTHPESFDFADA